MAKQKQDQSLRLLIERFTGELSAAIADQVEAQVAVALAGLKSMRPAAGSGKEKARPDGRRAGRLCPVPTCGKPGAGPRNRWFCKDHSKKLSATEQRSILERNRRLSAEGKLPTQVPAQRIVRLPPKEPRARRTLDMSCRVPGCPNRSRGPRAGFICDTHRAQLSPAEQKEARDNWNDRVKGRGKREVQAAPEPVRPSAPVPVPPIVRKAETAAEG